ncbi:MAG: ATP-binding protein [Acidobacteria bacterium]|nr:ATP-binding protein [Acidobacteriota bacterium]
MNDRLMEQLLHEGESSSLDYKRDQYLFAGASNEDKSELLKDILAFANGWRHAEAYILIGVDEVQGGRSTVVEVSHHIPENDLQQFVNSKTNRPVAFSYRAYPFEGKQVGVITIPQQDRPIYLNKDYGRLKKQVVYYRQGTTTAIASPDDIARMGTPVEIKKLLEGEREEAKKEQVRLSLGLSTQDGFYADIYNSGEVPVYIKEVALGRDLGPDKTMRTPLLATLAVPVADGRGSVGHVAPGQKNHDVPARKEGHFVLPRFPSAVVQQMATCSPETVWLSVSTYGGEIYRVPGEQVQPVLAEVVKLWEAIEEAAKPKNLQVVFYIHEGGIIKEVGTIRALLVKPGEGRQVEVRLEPISRFSIPQEDEEWLAQDLVNNKVIGRLGQYEWRVE